MLPGALAVLYTRGDRDLLSTLGDLRACSIGMIKTYKSSALEI